jgi:hypothetical protein
MPKNKFVNLDNEQKEIENGLEFFRKSGYSEKEIELIRLSLTDQLERKRRALNSGEQENIEEMLEATRKLVAGYGKTFTPEQERLLREYLIAGLKSFYEKHAEDLERIEAAVESAQGDILSPEEFENTLEELSQKRPQSEKEKAGQAIGVEEIETTIKYWEKLGLRDEIEDLIAGFPDLAEKLKAPVFALDVYSFSSTNEFMRQTEGVFKHFKAVNLKEKLEGVNVGVRRIILKFALDELGIDPQSPELIKVEKREEKINNEVGQFTVQCFKTNQENVFLVTDGTDWWLELTKS